MHYRTFQEYVQAREGLLLADRPAAAGLPRINPFPATQAQLKRILVRAAGPTPTKQPASRKIDYRAAVRQGLLP
jgi:hypothetical protein